jgi:group I intron endonuclease
MGCLIVLIYRITNTVNGKVYIGQTIDADPSERWKAHKSLKSSGNRHWKSAIKKYGWENFLCEVIESFDLTSGVDGRVWLDEREEYWIQHHGSLDREKGYNLRHGGSRGAIPVEECTRISKTLKAYYAENANPFEGRTHSDETRRILSEKATGRPAHNKGKPMPEHQRIALNYKGRPAPNKGKPMPKHQLDMLVAIHTGRKQSAEEIAKRATSLRGNQNRRGIPHDDVTKARIAASVRETLACKRAAALVGKLT